MSAAPFGPVMIVPFWLTDRFRKVTTVTGRGKFDSHVCNLMPRQQSKSMKLSHASGSVQGHWTGCCRIYANCGGGQQRQESFRQQPSNLSGAR